MRTLICSGGCDACEGQALALRLRRRAARATVVRGPVPRARSLILAILSILAILLQTRAIKGLTDLFCWLRLRSIDIKVFQTFSACSCGLILNILQILTILFILLQTAERWRGTGPRATGGSPVPVEQDRLILPIRARALPNYGEMGL